MRRVCSIFSQILQLFPRAEFEQLVREHRAERYTKGFSSWGQFVGMLFCQLGQAKSLREIHEGLRASEGKLRHLGLRGAPARSSLAYANQHRPHELFRDLLERLYARCLKELGELGRGGKRLKLPYKLYSLDATVISLCAEVFDWAGFRATKGALKLHLLLDHDGHLPAYAVVTPGRRHELRVARRLKLERGALVVFDRGYTDYEWFRALSEQGVWFVTRLKRNAECLVVERRQLSEAERAAGVVADEVVLFWSEADDGEAPFYRRVRYWDAEGERELVFLTNHLELGASVVAEVYRQRWQIELFFKALKQHLRVKTFVGTSANALKTQIWTALIAMLVIKYLQLRSQFGWSLSRLVALLRQQLFVYRDLWRWIESPFEAPPEPPGELPEQLVMRW